MNKIFFTTLALLLFICADAAGQKRINKVSVKPDTVTVDSVEYQLLIFDTAFDAWLATKPSAKFYSQSYYESWNRQYVMEWNMRHMSQTGRGPIYETRIDYDSKVDYGLDLNYRLYYYFKYFEETNRVKLINSSR